MNFTPENYRLDLDLSSYNRAKKNDTGIQKSVQSAYNNMTSLMNEKDAFTTLGQFKNQTGMRDTDVEQALMWNPGRYSELANKYGGSGGGLLSQANQSNAGATQTNQNGSFTGVQGSGQINTTMGNQNATNTGGNADPVTQAYRTVLGRDPDDEGLAYWQQQYANGNMTQDDLNYQMAQAALQYDNQNGQYDQSVANAQTYLNGLNQGGDQNNNQGGSQSTQSRFGMVSPNITTVPQSDVNQYEATPWTPDKVSVGPENTVSGRMAQLMSGNSEYRQMAEADALREANRRGLSNSSMAIDSGYATALRQAQGIAEYDANVQNQFDLSNQQVENRSREDFSSATDAANSANTQYANSFLSANMEAINNAASQFATAENEAALQESRFQLEEILNGINDEAQRERTQDQIAAGLIESGLNAGVFSNQDTAANWLGMIGDVYPQMGLSVTKAMASDASSEVI